MSLSIDTSSILQNLDQYSVSDKKQLLKLLDEYETAKTKKSAQEDYLSFVREVWPAFINGNHHKVMADAFKDVIDGKLKRLIINMPPRHTKSEFASYLLPAWFLGKYPNKKVIQTAHTAELAVGFGRKVRNLVGDKDFQEIFGEVK